MRRPIRFVLATAGSGCTTVQLDWSPGQPGKPVSTEAWWGLNGLYLLDEDGPSPDAPSGSYAGCTSREIARGATPGLLTHGKDEVPLTTVRAALVRRLLPILREVSAARARGDHAYAAGRWACVGRGKAAAIVEINAEIRRLASEPRWHATRTASGSVIVGLADPGTPLGWHRGEDGITYAVAPQSALSLDGWPQPEASEIERWADRYEAGR